MGDCAQLCFAEELTNCTYDKFYNDKCDKGCDNEYCSWYLWGSNFKTPFETDNDQCQAQNNTIISSSCAESSINSPYVDPIIAQWVQPKCDRLCGILYMFDLFCNDKI